MNSPLRPGAFALLIDRAGVSAWLATAKPGDTLEYHRGYLAADRWPGWGWEDGTYGARVVLGHVADLMWGQAERGTVHLIQQRHDAGNYSYIAVRSRRAA